MAKLKEHMDATEEFQEMDIDPQSLKKLWEFSTCEALDFSECLAVWMLEHEFSPGNSEDFCRDFFEKKISLFQRRKPEAFRELTAAYEKIFSDLVYFPLPRTTGRKKEFDFEDGYGNPRTYGGERVHEGTDIFGIQGESGYYPVVSMTDGIVEKVGWLPLGGYRIGVRSPGGGYFYYAHLSSYEKNFQAGDQVRAGEVLGLMGDTGYGPEGTRGRFPVHLHVGIYIDNSRGEEMSINPYPILVLLENQTQEYQY